MNRANRRATAGLAAVAILVSGAASAAAPGREVLPIAHMGEHGGAFRVDPPPAGQTPEERMQWMLEERDALGRTPAEWIRWARALSLEATVVSDARADLPSAVARIYAAVGLPVPDLDALSDHAAVLPARVRDAFAELVAVVAGVYEQQVPLARAIAARMPSFDGTVPAVTAAERDAMARRQKLILAALARFRARAERELASMPRATRADAPLFSDPEGLVVLGGMGNGSYGRSGLISDPVLLVEPAGSDTYTNSAGGACPVSPPGFGGPWLQCNLLALSVVADLGNDESTPSDDTYSYVGPPAAVQGAGGPGGIGMLVDLAGDDRYYARMTRGNTQPWGPTYYFDGGGQGYGYAGNGLLLDVSGDDRYRFDVYSSAGRSIWAFAQGFGGAGGLGVASDVIGEDDWLSHGLGLVGGGFQGLYTVGVGFYAGVGIATDTGRGDDVYYGTVTAQTVDLYAIGFGAFGGVGIMADDGGDDDYYTFQEGKNPFINPLLNCAYGTGSFGGVGIMVEAGGDDVYYGASVSIRGASVMDSGFGGPGVAYGLFADTGGNDRYTMYARGTSTMIEGRGLYEPGGGDFGLGHNTWGTFVDIGGDDTYQGGHGADDTQWPFGVDRDV